MSVNSTGNSLKNTSKTNSNNKSSSNPTKAIDAPSLKNTSKQSLSGNNNNMANNNMAKNNVAKNNVAKNNVNNDNNANITTTGLSSVNNNLQTVKEASGVYEIVSENYMILLAITSAIVIIIIIYFFSQTFRVGRTLSHMQTYQEFQQMESMDYSTYGNTRIGNYHIASAYNASHSGYQMYDYTSEKITLACLQGGARYLEFNVFNSEYGPTAYPVSSMGYKKGEWKMMVNDTPIETIFEIIADNAFKIYDGVEGCYNPDDPIFIGLNLNNNSNLPCLNVLALLITKYFSERLLPNAYSYQNSNAIAELTLNKLMGKVVIFSSDGFQGSGMEEVVNYSWNNTTSNPNHSMRRLLYSDLTAPGFNSQELIDFNRTGLTIIVPHTEGDFWNTNYNPVVAKELGCQFIAMEFQYVDANMDYYITLFKNRAMVLKDDELLKGKNNAKRPVTTNSND
jgi:hypothetical protein